MAYKDLQQALDKAGEEGKEIWVAEGIYRPSRRTYSSDPRSATFLIQPGIELIGGFEGTEPVYNGTDCIREPQGSAYQTILSGDINADDDGISNWPPDLSYLTSLLDDNVYHVVTTKGATGAKGIYIRNLTIKGGVATGTSYSGVGGGIYNPSCSPSFEFCGFIKNISNEHGGGMYSGNSIPLLKNCLFQSNVSLWGNGAGLYISGGTGNTSIDASVFDGNEAIDTTNSSIGGACYFVGADASIVNSIMVKNTATNTGASVFSNQSTVSIINSTFSLNESPGANVTGDSADISVVNTILWDDDCGSELSGDVFNVSYSCVKDGYAGTGNISINPVFVSPSQPAGTNGYYGDENDGLRLQSTSSCKDAGTSTTAPARDFILVDRPFGNFVDIGAYEYIEHVAPKGPFGRLQGGTFVPVEHVDIIDYIYHWKYVRLFSRSKLARVLRIAISKVQYSGSKNSVYIFLRGADVSGSPLPGSKEVRIDLTKVNEDNDSTYYQSKTDDWGKPLLFVNDTAFQNWPNNWAHVIYLDSNAAINYRLPWSQFY
jgi:hypothetical protein